jgi:hypothetical protein
MVPITEISDQKNDYSLNLPRYIDSTEPEDIHDIEGHLRGGIPNRDIDALQRYWYIFSGLRSDLLKNDSTVAASRSSRFSERKSVASYSTKRGTEIAGTNVLSSSSKSKALDAPRRDRAAATSTLVSNTTLISIRFPRLRFRLRSDRRADKPENQSLLQVSIRHRGRCYLLTALFINLFSGPLKLMIDPWISVKRLD